MTNINSEHLSYFLTLRYNPFQKSILKPLEPKDFTTKNFADIELEINKNIKNSLLKEKNENDFQTLSLSLSGGIDSGLTLAKIREILPEVKVSCVGMGFGNSDDEIKRAKELARIYDCDFAEVIKENILDELPKLIGIVREPRWNLYNFYAIEEGKRKSNFFYTGDGGDELFGGYTFRLKKFLMLFNDKQHWKEKAKLYLECHERDWVQDQEQMFGRRINFSWDQIYNLFKSFFNNQLYPINQVFLADFNGKLLYDWSLTNASYEKYFDVKINSIFLTDAMISFATHVDWKEKYNLESGLGKIPLRKILKKHIGFQNEKMSKKGFSTNLEELWNKNSKEIIFKYVNKNSEIVKEKIIDFEWLKKTTERLNNSVRHEVRYINKLMSLLSLEIWYKIFISKTMKQTEKI